MADNNTIHHLLDLYDEEITKMLMVKQFVLRLWDNVYILML